MAQIRFDRVLLPLLLAAPGIAQGIQWEASWAAATERAKTEKKVLFLAVNMDGERANDHTAKKVYKDKGLVALSELTVNAVASTFEHGRSKCSRFGQIPCTAHQDVEMRAREAGVLKADSEGFVIAPQHLWLDPEGKVLLSVPFQVEVEELTWCFVTAIRKLDENSAVEMPEEARPPWRLVADGVADPGELKRLAPLTREEALELIAELKKGGTGGRGQGGRGGGWRERFEKLYRLIRADEPEAIEFVKQQLNSGFLVSWRDGELLAGAIRVIGATSPPSYWVVVEAHIKHSKDSIRSEVAVALEQLGAEKSLKAVKVGLRHEKEEAVRKNWLRALGTTGKEDKAAHRELLKAAKAKGPELRRINAIIALGSTTGNDKIEDFLRNGLRNPMPNERKAVALAMAISRGEGYEEELGAALKEERSDEIKAVFEAALKVLKGGELKEIAEQVSELAGDEIPRNRIFGVRSE